MTDTVQKVAESFECKPVEGMLSHQLNQNVIDGEKTIIQNPTEAQRKEHDKFDFELHEVYAIDVLISSGEGHGREKDARVSIYKKTDETYMLKMKNSREFFTAVNKKFGPMPFNLRSLDSETKAKMGVVECVTHKLVVPFQVLYEKESEVVAQFKFTVLLMPNGPHRITGLPFEEELYSSEHSVKDADIQVKPLFFTKSGFGISFFIFVEIAEDLCQPQGRQEKEEGRWESRGIGRRRGCTPNPGWALKTLRSNW